MSGPVEHAQTGVEHASTAFDLGRYEPRASFVIPLRAALAEPTTQNPRALLRTRLSALPFEAIAPAIKATRQVLRPPFDHALERKTDTRTPHEREVFDYVTTITDSAGLPHDAPEEDKTLRQKYLESSQNYRYYEVFSRLQAYRPDRQAFIEGITTHWQGVQERQQPEQPDDTIIADLWTRLRSSLDSARQQAKRERDADLAQHHQRKKWQESQGVDYSTVLKQTATSDNPSLPPEEIVLIVNALRAIPPEKSAQILWESVLADREKAALKEQLHAYHVLKEATTKEFPSYQDPAFRKFITEHPDYENGVSSVVGIETILVGDRHTVPQHIRNALQNPDPQWDNVWGIESSNTNLLNGYVLDVASAFLETSIAAG